jgi:hypothetical protein
VTGCTYCGILATICAIKTHRISTSLECSDSCRSPEDRVWPAIVAGLRRLGDSYEALCVPPLEKTLRPFQEGSLGEQLRKAAKRAQKLAALADALVVSGSGELVAQAPLLSEHHPLVLTT